MRTRSASACFVVVCCAVVFAGSQDPPQDPPPQQPVFRTRVDAVTADVIVTDKNGHPVTDLTKDDFEIRESGKIQQVETFKLVQLNDAIDPDANYSAIRSLEDEEIEAARDDLRLIVIFFDDYHIHRGNAYAMRAQLAGFVRSLNPRDLVAVMHPLTPDTALTFSRDHAATKAT
jgi:VWFA-related protein